MKKINTKNNGFTSIHIVLFKSVPQAQTKPKINKGFVNSNTSKKCNG